MVREFTIGLLQFGSTLDKNKNLEKISSMLKRVNADVIVLPEYSMFPISKLTPDEVFNLAESVDGPYVTELAKLAREHSTYVLATYFEKAERPKVFNSASLITPSGNVLITYRKIHLFNAYGYRESDYMIPGAKPSDVVQVKNVNLAVAICFDIRFPELFRTYALRGAELVLIPSAWYRGPLKEETLAFLARARAHENTIYVALAVQYSSEFTGRSMVVDPLGTVLLDLGVGEKYVEFTIDVDYIHEVRKALPLLNLRRPELYRI